MRKLTGEWVRKADADMTAAVTLAGTTPPLRDPVCFHCQQAAEKYLKALLQELGLRVPREHNLDVLLDLLLPHDPGLRGLRRGLKQLSKYAVEYRYPGFRATARQVQSAL